MRVVVAMSGGVDSSVAALRLRDAGHDVIGVFLRNGIEASSSGAAGRRPGRHQGCCSVRDAGDAEEVAGLLGIPFYSLDHSSDFTQIIDSFVQDYAEGRTPNPCVQCNREVKFGALLEFARAQGATYVATGHYALCRTDGAEVVLERAPDRAKDQSYVLATVASNALRQACFPIGELHKEEVRQQAERAGLPVHSKAESQEICFVPSGDYRDLLRQRRPDLMRSGSIVTAEGQVVGEHKGSAGFTVGQRRGLGIGGGEPFFVLQTNPQRNEVIVGRREQLAQATAAVTEVNWLAAAKRALERHEVDVQVRAHHRPRAAIAQRQEDGSLKLEWPAPGEQVTPGQIAVLYQQDRVIAAGRFRAAIKRDVPGRR